jgi:hypothetical protein
MDDNQPTGETMSEGSPIVEGQEKENSSSLSPEFIKMAHSLIDDASPEQLQYIQDCCTEEMNETPGESTKENEGSETPEQYSSEDMPKD